jgi:hypothetical protein
MPKKMPKPEVFGSIKSILDQDYADAMENLTEGMKRAAIQGLFSPTDPERNFGMFKRTVRMLLSQGDNFIVDFLNKVDPKTLTDPKIAKDFATTVANKLGGFDAQKAMNYAAGIIEGHHGVSVDSIFSAAKHLPMKDRLEFIRTLSNEYGVSGTVGGDMYPVSRFAHQGKGTGSVFPKASAHTTANPLEIANSKGFPVNTGTWSREFDFSDITDPRKLADAFMQQSGFPQMAMADQAFDSPEELGIRKELAERLGIRERDLYTKSKDFNPRGQAIQKKIKELGIDVQEMVHRHYGVPYTPRAPLVKDPNAPKRVPKPTVAPTFEEASQFAKGWFDEADFRPTQAPIAQLMPTKVVRNPSVALGQQAAAIVNREPLPQPKPQPLPQPQPAPKPQPQPQPQPQAKPQPQPQAKPQAKPQPQPQAKPQPKVRVGTGRWAAAAASRPPSSTASAGRRSLTIGQNPLSPLNRGSAASGAIERSTNDAIQDAPGWSPFWLKLAD